MSLFEFCLGTLGPEKSTAKPEPVKAEPPPEAKPDTNATAAAAVTTTPLTLASRRRGIKRPDPAAATQENDKKRARKRKRWWSGCKQFIDFLFQKKHQGFLTIILRDFLFSIHKTMFSDRIPVLPTGGPHGVGVDGLYEVDQNADGPGDDKKATRSGPLRRPQRDFCRCQAHVRKLLPVQPTRSRCRQNGEKSRGSCSKEVIFVIHFKGTYHLEMLSPIIF